MDDLKNAIFVLDVEVVMLPFGSCPKWVIKTSSCLSQMSRQTFWKVE